MRECCCCNCCECSVNEQRKRNRVSDPLAFLDLLSQSTRGIGPSIANPLIVRLNDEEERNSIVGSKRSNISIPPVIGFPPDPLYPSDIRSSPLAYTPIYRAGQKEMFMISDKYTDHGPSAESRSYTTNGSFPSWDGVTTTSLWVLQTDSEEQKIAHRQAVYDFLFPDDGFCIIGLEQLYNLHTPFVDSANPLPHEIENWNNLVLNHFRFLLELNPIAMDQSLFLLATWANQRKGTHIWDSYTGALDSAYGPCIPGTNLHCGDTFAPLQLYEQAPYWNDYYVNYPAPNTHELISYSSGGAAVMLQVWNGTWMTTLSRQLRNFMRNGVYYLGGHVGPFLYRPRYGYDFHTGGSGIRYKFKGSLQQPPSGFTV